MALMMHIKRKGISVNVYLVGKLTPGSRGLRTIWSTWKRLRLQVLLKIRVNLFLWRAELLIEQINHENYTGEAKERGQPRPGIEPSPEDVLQN